MRGEIRVAGEFVIELREDEFENFLEDINSCVREHLVFQIFDKLAETAALTSLGVALFLVFQKRVNRPRLPCDHFNRLMRTGEGWDFLEIVRVFPVPDDDLRAVAPNGKRRTGRVGVALELLLAAFSRSLLHLDDDVRNGRPISVEDHDIRPLRGVSSERDRIFHLDPRKRIFVTVQKLVQAELANDFLRLREHFLLPDEALDIRIVVFPHDEFFNRRNRLVIKVRGAGELGKKPWEEVGDGHRVIPQSAPWHLSNREKTPTPLPKG